MFEVQCAGRTATALLEIYLGPPHRGAVLQGLVKHGDGEHIQP